MAAEAVASGSSRQPAVSSNNVALRIRTASLPVDDPFDAGTVVNPLLVERIRAPTGSFAFGQNAKLLQFFAAFVPLPRARQLFPAGILGGQKGRVRERQCRPAGFSG